jgi:predicted transcriptional regulator YdeE
MTTSLPQRPDLDQLRRQAKDLLKAHKKGYLEVCVLLRHLHRFSRVSDADILSSDIKLNEVQFAVALEHGFSSWNALKQHIEALPNTSPTIVSAPDSRWKIVERDALTLVGMVSQGKDLGQLEIYDLWVEFMEHARLIKNNKEEGITYEFHSYPQGWEPLKYFYCMVAINVTRPEDVPDNMFVKTLPAAKYALYTHSFALGGFDVSCRAISQWLETSEYKHSTSYDLQRYDARFKGLDNPESEMGFLIPVGLKNYEEAQK